MNIIWSAVIGLVVVGSYFWYATIVKRKTRVFEALAGIDVQYCAGPSFIDGRTR